MIQIIDKLISHFFQGSSETGKKKYTGLSGSIYVFLVWRVGLVLEIFLICVLLLLLSCGTGLETQILSGPKICG